MKKILVGISVIIAFCSFGLYSLETKAVYYQYYLKSWSRDFIIKTGAWNGGTYAHKQVLYPVGSYVVHTSSTRVGTTSTIATYRYVNYYNGEW